MAVFKCKMCGANLEISEGLSVLTCEYCNTQQTLPRIDSDKRAQLYDRANHFRRENEFDKAMGIYEMILGDDKEDCECYWGIVLCRYGIEYVEDPRSHKRIPTVNRAQFTSIFDDDDYKNAIKYADALQKEVYEAEANVIDKIQKGILAISQKEEPFDVFICYKETDSSGNRTQDSVYAQDIYTALTKEGYKVFFSRITLEDKLGSAYEPYIFAALNSAKVMIVVGTDKDNFNAVWVRNEWSRFITLIKAGKEKTLIPVYKEISPYDMPEEFQYLQAQDMGKIGFMQDLVRGVAKLVGEDKTAVKETVVVNQSNTQVEPLLKRAFMFLEDGDFARADEFFEQVLNIDPENAQAYLGKLLVECKVRGFEDLQKCDKPFVNSVNYQKVVRFGDDNLKNTLLSYINLINERIENAKKDEIYNQGVNNLSKAKTIDDYQRTINVFESISGWRNSDEYIDRCKQQIVILKKQLEEAREEKIRRDNELRELKVKKKKKRRRIAGFSVSIIATILSVALLLVTVVIPKVKFKDVVAISAGGGHTVGLKSDGTVVSSIGSSYQRALSNWTDIVAISAGSRDTTVGLKSDGTVFAIGEPSLVNTVFHWTDIVAISVGGNHTVGLESDGTVCATGHNGIGQCDVSEWTDIVAVSAGWNHTLGLKSDGTVIAIGSNDNGECNVGNWTDIVAISAGNIHTVGLKSDGTVVAVGSNGNGECDVSDWTDIVAISAGYAHTVGLKSDGTVVAVGDNEYGQCDVFDWTDIVAISAGNVHTVGLKSDGTVVAVGSNTNGRCLVGAESFFTSIENIFKYGF